MSVTPIQIPLQIQIQLEPAGTPAGVVSPVLYVFVKRFMDEAGNTLGQQQVNMPIHASEVPDDVMAALSAQAARMGFTLGRA